MKIAIVERATNLIVETYEADAIDTSSANRSWLRGPEFCDHLEIPEGIAPEIAVAATIPVVEAVPSKWTKDGEADVFEQPTTEVEDDSWTHHEAVAEIPAEPEYWTKEGEENLLEDPEDETWTHVPGVPAVPAVPEHWSKEGHEDALEQPMAEIPDETWTFVPGSPAIPEHRGIVASEDLKRTANKTALDVYSAQRGSEADAAIRLLEDAVEEGADETTYIAAAVSLVDVVANPNSTEQQKTEANAALASYRSLFAAIQAERSDRDADIAAFTPPHPEVDPLYPA